MADPGFPVGGRGPHRGGLGSRGGYVSKILYVSTKESGPFGVRRASANADLPMMSYFTRYISLLKILACAVRSEHNVPNKNMTSVSTYAIAFAGKICKNCQI